MSVPRSAQYVELLFALRSTAMDDVSHEVSVDPVDNARIDISDLELGGHLGVSGTAIDPDTSAIRQAPSVSATITVMPALTCRKTGSDFGAATVLAWSTDIPSWLVQLYLYA